MIWANLLHLGMNMWDDRDSGRKDFLVGGENYIQAKPYLRFDTALWEGLLKRMAAVGMNMVVLDLGEGVRYESHPELAAKGAWTPARLRRELAKMRRMGIEPIPKMNFSTCHDAWLGVYSRMVSTPRYYEVCRDLISEAVALFDTPRFFHLGYDEETAAHQRNQSYAVMRQHELWWHDFYFFVKEVERHNVRPWIWSDFCWGHHDEFFAKMPKSVLQSNWYYGATFDRRRLKKASRAYVGAYLELEKHGYDQVPTGSNHSNDVNFGATVAFCRRHIAPERLLGFLQTAWRPTVEAFRARHEAAVEQVGRAMGEASSPERNP